MVARSFVDRFSTRMHPKQPAIIAQVRKALAGPDRQVTLAGLTGSAPAYFLAQLFPTLHQPVLVLCADTDAADELQRELAFFAGSAAEVLGFPAWDTSPFEAGTPHPEVVGQRLNTLFRLTDGRPRLVVAPLAAVHQRVLPRSVLGEVAEYLLPGEETDHEGLIGKLVKLGYSHVPLVEDRGTFARRGGILDVFPPNLPHPVRLEFFGDFVETIRVFDPLTQRSLNPVTELVLLPSRELLLTPPVLTAFASRLKRRCDDLEVPADRRRAYLEQLQSAIYPPGVDCLQPLFHPGLETLFDYLGANALIVVMDPEGMRAAGEEWQLELTHGEARAQEREQIIPLRDELFLPPAELAQRLALGRQLFIPRLAVAGEGGQTLEMRALENLDLKLPAGTGGGEILKPLVERLSGWLTAGERVLVVCHQKPQADRLMGLLEPYRLPLQLSGHEFPAARGHQERRVDILLGEISRGFRLPAEQLVVIAEEELFGKRQRRRGLSAVRTKQILSSLAELKPGDMMVHLDFGVGIYRGLQHLKTGTVEGDFLLLEYAGADRLYLPVDRLNLVQRYVGAEGVEPRVDKLGGAGWEKAKAKAKAAVAEMAGELLEIYAARQVKEGFSFSPPDELYREFEAAFAYEETPDQLAAIEDVLADMQSSRPMDRLVCGDVGYGKTEVALRGAFKAALDGKQVAVLVPTTILAQQHLETFRNRFKDYPVTVEMLSRFRSPAEQKAILARVKKGEVDVIIGTHRLLQADLQFKDLGLLIVDEEQRFGVAHKEKLKKMRATVDLMTLTATPIPRTLYMSMMGIRDLSIIDTPPVDRLAIKTYVARLADDLIREAVLRELRRGGQIFFVHNRVQTIGAMAEHLQRVVPEAKIAVGHGQMDEKELEKVMLGFMHGESNLLLCTTIIESGLDISNANTLIVNRADTFGLAQLYQLRGRVGRSKQRAHAYFLLPGEGAITSDARERLKILQDITELGAGFRIATHDLELRGAGDLLGGSQSGQISAVGFELYTELLEEAIQQLKGEEPAAQVEPEIKLGIPAFIPEAYVKDPNQRLVLYKKLTQANDGGDIVAVADELVDRYGKLPPATEFLLAVMRLRLQLKRLLVKEIEQSADRLVLSFHQKTPVSPDTIIGLIRHQPKKYQFTPDFRLVVMVKDTSFDGVLAEASQLCDLLAAS